MVGRTPSRTQRSPARPDALFKLLRELDIRPPGAVEFKLVSRWAAKHVWRVDVNDQPWAYVRYLLGDADQYPDRWRHMRMGELLYRAKVGPRILGLTAAADALDGRAAIVETALLPVTRDQLESRASEAMRLFARLHTDSELHEALAEDFNEADRRGFSPLTRYFAENRERWFEAVTDRWLEVGLSEIEIASKVVTDLMAELDVLQRHSEQIGVIVPAHNDPNHGNFMVNRKGELRMIDFEELALNNPVADVGVFLVWYVDVDQHLPLLEDYGLVDPDSMLERMQVWVPLRYISIASHWAARLTRADDRSEWVFALESVDEWLRGACELIFGGEVPAMQARRLERLRESLLVRGETLFPDENETDEANDEDTEDEE